MGQIKMPTTPLRVNIAKLEGALKNLSAAISNNTSREHCLRLWSHFIRMRDGNRCVACHSRKSLSAHHVIRKSFLNEAELYTGNGITLCRDCHKEPHKAYNGRPNLALPMDAEGGEQIETMTALFWLLLDDARKRYLLREDFYFLSESTLSRFKLFQGFDWNAPFPGTAIEQAYLIWRQTPRGMRDAVLAANGFKLPKNFIQTGRVVIVFESGHIETIK